MSNLFSNFVFRVLLPKPEGRWLFVCVVYWCCQLLIFVNVCVCVCGALVELY